VKNPAELLEGLNVAIYQDPGLSYPCAAPYSPHIRYPEYPLYDLLGEEENNVYDAVRSTLALLGLDLENFSKPSWNPFKEIICPGDTVVIKPNFVLDRHEEGGDLFSIITHPSVIRAVVDYVYLALAGKGKIIIADASQMDCNFGALLEKTKLHFIQDLYSKELGFEIEISDLRDFWLDRGGSPKAAYQKNRYRLPGDPEGSVLVRLGKDSLFYGVDNHARFYGADYNREEVRRYHHGDVQEYMLSKTILSADVVILVPKLKVHKKVGVTLNLKGLVGTVVNKNCLVHYRLGTPSKGGDQFPDRALNKKQDMVVRWQRYAFDKLLAHKNPVTDLIYDIGVRVAKPLFKHLGFRLGRDKVILDCGNWHGNNSAWRMVDDLLRVFLYADKEGRLQGAPIRRIFSVIDGVTAGEKNGPLTPYSKRCGVLIAGFNPSKVDIVAARLMGFDYNKIKMLSYVVQHPQVFRTVVEKIAIHSNQGIFDNLLASDNRRKYFDFEPPPGWERSIEV
jgi:uncharacterized protein (DUF362 family)